ncbi:hypothetical protein G6F40_015052 [Rhizopus arrhizus]|nr:hypothetical protein G6F40_015052 [Rhizopus arrhizus]
MISTSRMPASISTLSGYGGADALQAVAAIQHAVDPLLVAQVPVNGKGDALLEGVGRFPAEVVLQLGGVDRIAAVVPRTVGHVSPTWPLASTVRMASQWSDTNSQSLTCLPSPYTGSGSPASALAITSGISFSGK